MMPKRTRMKMALVLAAGGLVVGSTGTATTTDAKRPPNGKVMESKHGLDWEKHQRG